MLSNKNLQYDPWLSKECNKDVYRLNIDSDYLKKIDEKDSDEIRELKEVKEKKVFIYTKLPASALNYVEFVEKEGFHLIDTNVVLEKNYSANYIYNNNCELRFATSHDEAGAVNLAQDSFTYSRFHLDNNFSKKLADHIKAEWVRNYFKGVRGEWMVLACIDTRIVGFLQLTSNKNDTLVIDLIAVDPNYRRLGIANDMIAFAETKLTQFIYNRVGTQIANVPSLKLYHRMGFSIVSSSYVFHYHHA